MRLNLKLLIIFLVLGLNSKLSANEISNNALPTDPNVTHGTAEISQGANQLTIDQQTDKLITNWSSFNIGSDAKVQFNQPSSSSSALNHVNSADPSYIYGSLEANGKVILINPNGVIFSKGSRVDVGAIVASSLKLSDENFLKDNFVFEKDGIAGIVENYGTIKAFEGGTVALISSIVKNNRTIETPKGSTALLAGEKITLNLNYNQLISYTIDSGVLNSLVENNNAIVANNGQVILSARGLDAVRKSVVNNDGIIEAKGINTEGGKIFLEGDEITVKSNSTLNATGDNGGGQILVGGSWQNSDPTIYQAKTTTIEEGATLNASANNTGNGGEIVVWSDITNDQSITKVQGKLTAEGGKNSGNGGQIETSGRVIEINESEISTKAENGETGQWLIDTGNINIRSDDGTSFSSGSAPSGNRDITPATLISALNSNNITVTTGTGAYDIVIEDDIIYTGSNAITFDAGDDIYIQANVRAGKMRFFATDNIIGQTNNVTLTANNSSSDGVIMSANYGGVENGVGAINFSTDLTINTSGSNVKLGGQNDTGTGYTDATDWHGIEFQQLTINSNGGDIQITGESDNEAGVYFTDAASITSGGGDITIDGNNSTAGNYDIRFENTSGVASSINSTGGTISLIKGADTDDDMYIGAGSLTINSTASQSLPIDIAGSGALIKDGSGNTTLGGTNTYTGDTTVSNGTLTLTGNLSSSTDLIISPGATLDLQATQTVTSLDLDGTISNSTGSSTLTVSGASAIGGNITTYGNQIYSGAITLTGDSILTSSSGAITLGSTVNGGSSLTTSSSSNFIASGVIGGDIPLSSLSVTAGGNAQYSGNITTTGAITFNAVGNVDAGGTITLRTTNSNVTLNADSDGDGTGTFYGGTITINSGSGNVIIRGSTIANEGYSVVGTGTLTIESNAASFGDTFTSSYLSEAATLTGLTIGKSTNTSTVTMNSAISIAGAVTIYGNDINLNQAITDSGNITITAAEDIYINTGFTQIYSTGSGNFIKLLAKRNISNIINAPSITLTTTGGDILVASDTDNSGGGFITIVTGSTFESNGGDITIAGGSTTGSGYAKGYSGTAWYGEGLRLDGTVNIASSNGNIVLRGQAYNGSISAGQGASGISFYGSTSGTQTVDINSGTGTILIDAKGYSYTSQYSAALSFGLENSGDNDTTTIQSANTTSSAITINANHYQAGGNSKAIRNYYKPLTILATANGGGITINTSGVQNHEIHSNSEVQILAKTGDIQLLGGGTDQWFTMQGAAMYLGSKSGVNGGTSSSNIIFQSDDFYLYASSSFNFATTGTVTIRSVNNSFTDAQSLSTFTLNDNSKTMSGFTFGKSTNTSDITLDSAITTSGAVTVYGSTINLFSNITSSGAGDITISASTKIEDNTTRRSVTNSSGDIYLIADSDGAGQLDIGYLTLDAGSDDLILRGSTFSWGTDSNTPKPYINGTGGVTIESTGTAFGQGVDARWFYWNQDGDGNQISSLTIGKSTNTENVGFSYEVDNEDAATISVNGPIKAYTTGTGTVTLTANLVSASGTSLIQGELEGTGDFTQTTGTLQVNATGDNTSYTGDIKGDGAFTKLGNSILALSGANTYTGDTTISAGTLTIDGTGTLEGGSYDGAISNSGTFIYSSTTDQILAGAITGTGALTKQETSTLRLSGTNTYSGITTVSAGTLDVYTANSLGSGSVSLENETKFISTSGGSSKTFANDITLDSGTIEISVPFGSGSDLILSGDIDGSGKIKLTGDTNSRWLRLTGSNTFSGGIDITSDTATNKPILEIGSNNALGSGTITSYGTVDYQNIRFAGNHTVSNAFATSSSSAKLNFNTNGYSPTISGIISGSGPVTKSGTGTLTLSGNSNYAADTK